MDLSIFVAKVTALVMVAAGVAAVFSQVNFDRVYDEFVKSQGLTMVTGIFTLILGMILVEVHNVWEQNWTVLVTLIGWIALIKGVLLVAFPQAIGSFKPVVKNQQVIGMLMIVLGLVYGYFGFLS